MVHNSQSSLHTEPGCTVVNAVQTSTLVNSTDCSFQANDNEGCVIENPDPNSYGAAFAAGGGGIFVTEFAETGISYVVISPTVIVCPRFSQQIFFLYQCLVLLGTFILRSSRSMVVDSIFIAQQRPRLVAGQCEQHRYFIARQTRCELPIWLLRHR